MSNLVDHAKRELQIADVSEYGGMLSDAVIQLIEVFAKQGHSGYSAHTTVELFSRLAKFESISPLTDMADEWMEVGTDMWQSIRQSNCFSTDGGKTYYNIDEDIPEFADFTIHESKKMPISMVSVPQ